MSHGNRRARRQRRSELAQIVEGDLWLRQRFELRGDPRIAAAIPQQTIANAAIRNAAKLLFDGLQRLSRMRGAGEVEAHGEQRREPADGPRQVHVFQNALASMAFEV